MTTPLKTGPVRLILSAMVLAGAIATGPSAKGQSDVTQWSVLKGTTRDGQPAETMMSRYLKRKAEPHFQRWRDTYEGLETPEEIARYQAEMKAFFLRQIGGLPKERTPLNAKLVGRLQFKGFHIEKILFESRPRFYVTATLFLPDADRRPPPYPAVLMPVGHSSIGKANPRYHAAAMTLALHGIAAFVYDPIAQGERRHIRKEDGKTFSLGSTREHSMIGVAAVLLGQNTARIRIFDGVRSIDYLQSREDIDPHKIGCTGNSGGGTMTSYLMALDERVTAAAPGCYLTSFTAQFDNPQDAEQNIFGQVAFTMDQADYLLMRAPKPTLILTGTEDFFDVEGSWRSFRYGKRLFTRMGYAERIDLVENDDTHGYHENLREGAVRWMLRWLGGVDRPVQEPDGLPVLTPEDLYCTPGGSVMALEGARSAYDLNREYERSVLRPARLEFWSGTNPKQRLEKIRQLSGAHPLADASKARFEKVGQPFQHEGARVQGGIVVPEDGIELPTLVFSPETPADRCAVYVHEQGKTADMESVLALVDSGTLVVAVDVRRTGETAEVMKRQFWGSNGQAYLLGLSYVGMRTDDILAAARLATRGTFGPRVKTVDLISVGNVGVAALHAGALEGPLFRSIQIRRCLRSWLDVVNADRTEDQLVGAVHGALRYYDLPDLASLIGDKLRIVEPVDAVGALIKE